MTFGECGRAAYRKFGGWDVSASTQHKGKDSVCTAKAGPRQRKIVPEVQRVLGQSPTV